MTHATSIKAPRLRRRDRLRGQRTYLCLTLLAAFLLVLYVMVPSALPDKLDPFFQRLVGLGIALLAMVTAMFAVREYAGRYNRVRLPVIGGVRTSLIAGVVVFGLVVIWWLSPWAPIQPLN